MTKRGLYLQLLRALKPRISLVTFRGACTLENAGMDPEKSYIPHPETGKAALAPGTGGSYHGGLRPGKVSLRADFALHLRR